MKSICVLTIAVALLAPLQAQTKPAPAEKVDVVAVAGCLTEASPNAWTLTNATDPVTSNANAPSAKELAAMAKTGKNELRLIGVSEFNLPAHRGHNVLVKGLHVKAAPVSRLNVTSVTMLGADCPPK